MKSFKRTRQMFYMFLTIICLLSSVLAASQFLIIKKNEENLTKQRQAILLETQQKENELLQLQESLTSLKPTSVTLDDESDIQALRNLMNQSNQDENAQIKINKAEIRLETLKAKENKYNPFSGPSFKPSIVAQLDDLVKDDMSLYIRFLDDGSTYIHNPFQNYTMQSIDVSMFALYLNEKPLSESEYQDMQNMMASFDTYAINRLIDLYFPKDQKDYQKFLEDLGVLDPQTTINTLWKSGDMNVIDVGHTLCALYACLETDEDCFLKEVFPLIEDENYKKYVSPNTVNHEMALVYGDRPFVLAFLTNQEDENTLTKIYEILLNIK